MTSKKTRSAVESVKEVIDKELRELSVGSIVGAVTSISVIRTSLMIARSSPTFGLITLIVSLASATEIYKNVKRDVNGAIKLDMGMGTSSHET